MRGVGLMGMILGLLAGMKVVVATGKYAVLGPGWTEQQAEASVDPTADPARFVPPPTMAVLEVLP